MSRIRALLVDDNRAFLAIVRGFLATEARVVVVGAAASVQQALELVAEAQPDLVLLDAARAAPDNADGLIAEADVAANIAALITGLTAGSVRGTACDEPARATTARSDPPLRPSEPT